MTTVLGLTSVVLGGLLMGIGPCPIKLMRRFRYEHWALISGFVGIVLIPWTVTLTLCPNAIDAYRSIEPEILVKSNLWSLAWGLANVLIQICLVRVGFSLTTAIFTGFSVAVGVTMPMLVKGTGLFENAPDLTSPAGLTVLAGVAVMLCALLLVSMAGFGRAKSHREQEIREQKAVSGSFLGGLFMAVLAGVVSCGIGLVFVYSQGPIIAAMKYQGADDIPANFAVWAIGLLGGAMVTMLYPAWLLTKKRSWAVLLDGKELALAVIVGINFAASVALMGKGMLLLGVLGASVGFGIQRAAHMLGGQAVGFASGEWRGIGAKPKQMMYLAIVLLIVAAAIMCYGNTYL